MPLYGSVTAECVMVSHFRTCFANVRNPLVDELLLLARCDRGEV